VEYPDRFQKLMGHAKKKGYNDATIEEIKRRFGSGVVAAAEKEEANWQTSGVSVR
jgi:hypothetical protein